MDASQKPKKDARLDKLQIDVHAALRALIHPHSKPDFNRLQSSLPHLLPADRAVEAAKAIFEIRQQLKISG